MALAERIFAPIAHIRGKFKVTRMEMAHDGVLEHVPPLQTVARPGVPAARVLL